MKKQLLTALATAALLAALAPSAMAQNIAIVNGKPVPKSRMDALAQQMARAGRQIPPEMQGQLKDEVIAREIFVQEAQARGYRRHRRLQEPDGTGSPVHPDSRTVRRLTRRRTR